MCYSQSKWLSVGKGREGGEIPRHINKEEEEGFGAMNNSVLAPLGKEERKKGREGGSSSRGARHKKRHYHYFSIFAMWESDARQQKKPWRVATRRLEGGGRGGKPGGQKS